MVIPRTQTDSNDQKSTESCDRQVATEYEKWIANSKNVIPDLLFNSPFDVATRPCLGSKVNGQYHYINYSQFKEKISAFASALLTRDFNSKDKLVIISENREEWVVADIATMYAGGVVVPIYSTLSHTQVEYIVNHCDATMLVVSSQAQYDKVIKIIADINIHTIITMDAGIELQQLEHTLSLHLDDFYQAGRETLTSNTPLLQSRLAEIEENDTCSIIYTSGTTGNPKGVMLSHRNFIASAVHGIHIFYANQLRDNAIPKELSILPLSHVFARMVYFSIIVIAGGNVAFSENLNTIASDLQKVKPNLLVGVPRIFETIYQKIRHKLNNASPIQRRIADWAVDVGKEFYLAQANGEEIKLYLRLQYALAERLVYKKIQALFGSNLQALLSAGAKLRIDVAMFYCSIGLPLTEGYGLTETSPTITCSRPSAIRWGSVGKVVRSVAVQIAEDGEILVKGDNVMKGYYKDSEATAEAFTDDGWFHTGDLGKMDKDGYLEITGRKKEIIVLSNGENIGPAQIENLLTSSPYIEQAVLIGDNRPFVAALLVPNFAELRQYMKNNNLTYSNQSSMVNHAKVQTFIKEQVRQLTRGKVAKFATVRQFKLLNREFTAEHNEVTPTLKIKRHIVHENFSQHILSIYKDQ